MAENGVESTGDVTLDNAVKRWLEFDKVSRVMFYIQTCLASLSMSC